MENKNIQQELLKEFTGGQLMYRVQSCGLKEGGGAWARIVPYIKAKAITERLDEAFSFEGWQVVFRTEEEQVFCTLSIWSEKRNTWIQKEGGATIEKNSGFQGDHLKSAMSNAFKKSAEMFGIGRYLKDLGAEWAECSTTKKEGFQEAKTKNKTAIYWRPKTKNILSKEAAPETKNIKNELENIDFSCLDAKKENKKYYKNGEWQEPEEEDKQMGSVYEKTLINALNEKYGNESIRMINSIKAFYRISKLENLKLGTFKEIVLSNFDIEKFIKVS